MKKEEAIADAINEGIIEKEPKKFINLFGVQKYQEIKGIDDNLKDYYNKKSNYYSWHNSIYML